MYWKFPGVNSISIPVSSVGRAFAFGSGGCGFDPHLRHTKSDINMVTVAPLPGALHYKGKTGLFSHTLVAMDSIRNEVSIVISISWNNLFYNQT